jgi:hypothetical protein
MQAITDPVVISPTCQEFQGRRWYLCGNYFKIGGKGLHRAVWAAANGKIPPGRQWHVHHINHDRHDNRLANLELLSAREHLSERHPVTDEQREAMRQRALESGMEHTKAWHRSKAGRKWHREHAAAVWAKREPRDVVCVECSTVFETLDAGEVKFCGGACRARATRRRRREGVPITPSRQTSIGIVRKKEERTCEKCGEPFMGQVNKTRTTCSKRCASSLKWHRSKTEQTSTT